MRPRVDLSQSKAIYSEEFCSQKLFPIGFQFSTSQTKDALSLFFTRQSIVPLLVIHDQYRQVVFKMPEDLRSSIKKMGENESSTQGSETESCCWAGSRDYEGDK